MRCSIEKYLINFKSKAMKHLFPVLAVVSLFVLAACGGRQQNAQGAVEETVFEATVVVDTTATDTTVTDTAATDTTANVK